MFFMENVKIVKTVQTRSIEIRENSKKCLNKYWERERKKERCGELGGRAERVKKSKLSLNKH